MKDRPVFKDYTKQLIAIIFNVPINSGDKLYTFADRWLLLIGQLPVIIAPFFIYNYSPYLNYYAATLPVIAAYVFGGLLIAAYWLFFVYRFARFHVRWADPEAHPDENASENQNKFGFFLKTKNNRIVAFKSGGAFAALTAVIAAFTFLCCYIIYGLAPSRLYYGHKNDLDRLVEIVNDYNVILIEPDHTIPENVYVSGIKIEGTIGYQPSEELVIEIQNIFNRLWCGYINPIYKDESEDEYFCIRLSARWGQDCELLWYPEEVTQSDIAAEIGITMEWAENLTITKLDEHWWQVWYTCNWE